MEIQALGGRTFSLYISESELQRICIEPSNITAAQARDMVRSALGMESGTMLLDLFPGQRDLLIFVHNDPCGPEFFTFQNIDHIIESIISTAAQPASSLFSYNSQYILAVWGWRNEDTASFLEFGQRLDEPPLFLLHLREHGQLLLDCQAISTIKKVFSPA